MTRSLTEKYIDSIYNKIMTNEKLTSLFKHKGIQGGNNEEALIEEVFFFK